MAIETILVAVGSEETEQLDRLTQTVIDIAGPAGATVEEVGLALPLLR